MGINAFNRNSLIDFSKLKRTPLEIIESIDMLRLLENNLNIRMVNTEGKHIGVDTKDDLEEACHLMRSDSLFHEYINSI